MIPLRDTIKPLKPDYRDQKFIHSKKFGTTRLAELPKMGLGRVPLKINQQFDTNFCTAAATSSAAEYEQKRRFSFEFQVAAISRFSGEPILDGAEPRQAYKARSVYGCLPDEMTPVGWRLEFSSPEMVANWRVWPSEAWQAAKKYVSAGFFWLGEEYEPFDQVREALWAARNEDQVVMAAGRWYQAWNNIGPDGIIPAITTGRYTLHEYDFIDWTEINGIEYLIIHNSCGSEFGRGGLQLIDRKTMNAAWPRDYGDGTGLAIWRKVNPNDINALKQQWLTLAEIWASIIDSLLFKLKFGSVTNAAVLPLLAQLALLLKAIGALLPSLVHKPTPAPVPELPPVKQEPPAPAPIEELTLAQIMKLHDYRWARGPIEDRRALYQLGQRICKEEGLSIKMTADFLATVWGESGWNQWCVNTTTFDYGVAQFSQKYYLIEYKMTPEYALTHPGECLRIMARNFKNGRAKNWVAFANGTYKQHLNKSV